jgi:hypothetical protein
MIRPAKKATMAIVLVLFVLTAFQGVIVANHAWGYFHWARTANPFTIKLGENVSSTWEPHLALASADWDQSSVLNTTIVSGSANPRNCRPTTGRVEICNSTYGANGWLGVAQIWAKGGHITQATVKLNDTYHNNSPYNTYEWRQFVMCQEIGHTFGLNHQDEEFDNPNMGTCMDYTSNPGGGNLHPNAHDYAQLESIYTHLDSSTTLSSSPAASNHNFENPSEWGQLMKTKRGGRIQRFVRDLGNDEHLITFVIWA